MSSDERGFTIVDKRGQEEAAAAPERPAPERSPSTSKRLRAPRARPRCALRLSRFAAAWGTWRRSELASSTCASASAWSPGRKARLRAS